MALTEKTYVDKIEVVALSNTLSLREVTVILRDDVEISRTYQRYSVSRGMDTSSLSPEAAKLCETLWNAGVDSVLTSAE